MAAVHSIPTANDNMTAPNADHRLASEAYTELCRTLGQREPPSVWNALSHSEWLRRVALSEREGVAPLLYWCFKSHGWPPSTPDEARERLTRAYYVASAHNTLLLAEYDRIIGALHDGHITVVTVKGAALVHQLYPCIGLRPMGDIDLLVPRPEIDRAAHILEQLGYERIIVQSERLNRLIGTQLGFTTKSGPDLRIEVHWSLVASSVARYAPDMSWFWAQTEPFQTVAPFKTRSLLTLSPTAHLLYIATHALLEHGLSGARLIWLYDVHLILSRWASQVAWEELFSRAAAFGWGDALIATLKATSTCFGTPQSNEIEDMLTQDTALAGHVGLRKANERSKLKLAEHSRRLVGLSAWARLWYALAMVFPSPRYMRVHYGQAQRVWWPVLYVVRWATMLGQIARR